MIRLVPYRKIELRSPLSAAEVAQVLASSVERKRWIRLGRPTCPFEGTVTDSEFAFQRIISYRNSFLPQIRGTIAEAPSGSHVSITMQLHVAVLVFMLAWLGMSFVGGVVVLIAALADRAEIGVAAAPFGMFVFGWVLTTASFAFEARKAEQLLTSLIRGTVRVTEPAADKPPGFY